MSETQFTPGPWRVVYVGGGDWEVLDAAGNNVMVAGDAGRQAEFNVKLAAAAPELATEGAFLLARLEAFEREHVTGHSDEVYTDWAGHVVPSIERFRMILQRARSPQEQDAQTNAHGSK